MINLTEFQNYLKINVDSQNSQTNYLSQIRCFYKHYSEYNQQNINAYLANKVDMVAKQTFNVIIASFKQYNKFIKQDFEIPKIKYVCVSEKDYLTESELLNELLPYFSRLFEVKSEFFSFVVKFLFYTGIRPIEMCNLLTKDIYLENNIFIIRSPKDKEDKKVPFPDILKKDIEKYLQKNELKAFRLSYSSIKYIFVKINNELNYKRKVTPYQLRHGFAHYCLDNNIPIEKLQMLMGHSDLRTTMIYAKPRMEDALKSYFENIKPKS